MTQSLPAARGRPISITGLTKLLSRTPRADRGDTSGRAISSPRPEKDFADTAPAPRRGQLSGRRLAGAMEAGGGAGGTRGGER